MKRIVLWSVALLAAVTAVAYYSVPDMFREPLLAMNRSLSGLEE